MNRDVFDYVIMEGQKQFRDIQHQLIGTTNNLAVTYREGEVELIPNGLRIRRLVCPCV